MEGWGTKWAGVQGQLGISLHTSCADNGRRVSAGRQACLSWRAKTEKERERASFVAKGVGTHDEGLEPDSVGLQDWHVDQTVEIILVHRRV